MKIYLTSINEFGIKIRQVQQEEFRKVMFEEQPEFIPAKYEITIQHNDPELIQILYEKIREWVS